MFNMDYAEKLNAWNFRRLLALKYDVVVTNPPYMGTSNGNAKLIDYIKKNYPDSKADLFAVFIEHCGQMTKKNCYTAMITQHSWMFLSSFEKLREKLLHSDTVNMAHLGARAFEEIGGEVVQTTSWVQRKAHIHSYQGSYARLVDYGSQQEKENAFLAHSNLHTAQQENFSKIPGSPIAYWVGRSVFLAFEVNSPVSSFGEAKAGMTTGDNDRFLRLWFEINHSDIGLHASNRESALQLRKKWFPYNKGGGFRKWYGLNEYLVLWENDGQQIKNATKQGRKIASVRSERLYFKKSITWATLTTGMISCRHSEEGHLFDDKGSSCFMPSEYHNFVLCLINSVVGNYFLHILNPTMSFQSGNIGALPVRTCNVNSIEITILGKQNVVICKCDWDSFETSWDFNRHPLVCRVFKFSIDNALAEKYIEASYMEWRTECNERFNQLKANEEALNRIFIDMYSLQYELTPEVEDKDVTIRKADLGRDIRSFVSYAVGCMFGRYSLDVEGLAFAGGEWDDSKYTSFIPDADNVLPITDDAYFSDDIVTLFAEFVKVVYGAETLEQNLDFIANALGNKGNSSREVIRNYFLKDFYKDHVKIYQKRPIYWLFDSGKEDGFKALIYLHRYDQDTVGRVRADYLHKQQGFLENAITNCDYILQTSSNARDKADATKKKDKLVKQLAETRTYDQALAHIALQRIPLDLDDGVKVNYEKFQGIEVAREGQKALKIDLLGKI